MKLFSMHTELHRFDSLNAFVDAFQITSDDLILTSRGMHKRSLESLNLPCRFIYHDDYGKGEPSNMKIDSLIADANKAQFDRMIAIGGGSVLDISKVLILKDVEKSQDAFERKMELVKAHELICIPTTCGTGSEVTNLSIMEIPERSTKMGLADPVLIPDHAILIPELLKDLPYDNYLFSSVDALIHAVESYVSPKANSFTRTLAMESASMILDVYQQILAGGPDIRHDHHKDMLLASTMAGIAFGNAGVGAVHALSYPLGGTYHVPHGEANYQFFMAVFGKYHEKKPEGDLAQLGAALSEMITVEADEIWIEMSKLLDALIQRKPLREYGMSESEIETWADSVIEGQQRLLQNNYTELSRDEIRDIYKELY